MQDYEVLFTQFLSRKGLRLTQPRRQVLDMVFALHEHFDADQLYDRIRQVSADVSRATVYRTLPLLIEAGLIQQSLRFAARDKFEHIFGHPKHIHWVCQNCGLVTETALEEVLPGLKEIAGAIKFELKEANLNLSGVCWKCQESENENQ